MLAYELLYVGSYKLAVDDPCFFREHVAGLVQFRWLKKDVVGRSPLAKVAGCLAIGIVRCLLSHLARFRFRDDSVGWTACAKVGESICARAVLADGYNVKPLRFVLLVKLCYVGRFVAPVRTPGGEINDEH